MVLQILFNNILCDLVFLSPKNSFQPSISLLTNQYVLVLMYRQARSTRIFLKPHFIFSVIFVLLFVSLYVFFMFQWFQYETCSYRFCNIYRKHLSARLLFLTKLQRSRMQIYQKETPKQMFFCELYKFIQFFSIQVFTDHLQPSASVFCIFF